MSWINICGLITVIVMLIPNVIYAIKNKQAENKCKNHIVNILEQIGRYGCMFLMTFNIGFIEFGFHSKNGFVIWLITIPSLLLIYWILFVVYYKSSKLTLAILLAVIPSIIFILNGILLYHWVLLIFGIVFSTAHIYITYKNNV